jgi:copper oxidase (laccase) domain-containing protein
LDRVDVAFTDRHGGVSSPPFASLNFGYASGDDAGAVARNVALVAEALGTDDSHLVSSSQVHGAAVAEVNGTGEKLGRADALVTARVGVTLCVRPSQLLASPVDLCDGGAVHLGGAHQMGLIGA